MKRVNIYKNSVLTWSAYKRENEYQAWIDAAVASNLWGLVGTYTVEVLDATAEIESNRLQAEGISKQSAEAIFEPKSANIQSHIINTSNPHAVTKAQIGLDSVDNVSANSLRDRSTHTGVQLASTISDFTAAVQTVTIDAANINGGVVSNTEFSYLNGVTSAIQTQLNGKQATGNYITSLTGDVTASGPGTVAATLSNTGVTAGTYNSVTVDAKGRVTAGTNTAIVSFRTTVAQSTTSASYAVITEFTTATLQPGLYKFNFYGQSQTAATTTGIGYRIGAGTATISTINGKFLISQAADGTAKNYQYDQLAANTNVTSTAALAANTNFNTSGQGIIRITAAGTVRLEFRTEVANSAATLQPDSIFEIQLIA